MTAAGDAPASSHKPLAVVAGGGAALLPALTLLNPGRVPTGMGVVVWVGAVVMALLAVRIWRLGRREDRVGEAAGWSRGTRPLLKVFSAYFGVWAAVIAGVVLTAPNPLPALTWGGAAAMAAGSCVCWCVAEFVQGPAEPEPPRSGQNRLLEP